MRDFREFVAQNELMDLGYDGYPFTWRNNRDAMPIQQRLDRGLGSLGWFTFYPETRIQHVVLEGSKHAMLVLSTEKMDGRRRRRFMYEARWGKLEGCRDLVSEDWQKNYRGSHAFRLCEKMKFLSRNLKAWYKVRDRNSKKTIDCLKEEIRRDYQNKGFGMDEVHLKEKELKKVHNEEEAYWRGKSRVQWLNEGDKNTKFFHAQTMKRRSFNKIRGLENSNGEWTEDEQGIRSTTENYFTELFKSCRPNQFGDILRCVDSRVTLVDNYLLTAPVMVSEIEEAAFQIPLMRKSGPDGYPGSFYQDHWRL